MGNASALPILLNNHDHAQKRIQVSDRSCEPPKLETQVQPLRFICGVNLKSQID